jgi:hypothetical protein
MARIGKITRLPQAVRAQLNTRLQDGAEGKQIADWLNSLPQVKERLADKFDGRPINEQNVSAWRQGGYKSVFKNSPGPGDRAYKVMELRLLAVGRVPSRGALFWFLNRL